MKKIFTLLIGFVFSITVLNAQILGAPPEGFSYKATITKMLPNGNLTIVPMKTIGLMINILRGTDVGPIVYSETFTPKTNPSGQIDIVIGLNTDPGYIFSSIPWSDDIFFLQVWVDINGGTAYGITPMSTTQLLSVPYALHSKTVETGNWGNDYVKTDATLAGQGTDGSLLKIADNGVTSAKIDDATIVSADLGDNAVITSKINNGAVTGDKIAQAEATTGQALKWNGTNWSPDNDLIGTPGGTTGNLQFNNNGVLGGDALLVWNNSNNRLGIGTSTPNATLDVAGTVQIGSYGKIFSEIREITGLTNPSESFLGIVQNSHYVIFGYPPGYDRNNTRVLSAEIFYNVTEWRTLGYNYKRAGEDPKTLWCSLKEDYILLNYPNIDEFQEVPFRVLLMRVQ